MPRARYLGGRQAQTTRTRYTGGRSQAEPRTRYTGQSAAPPPPEHHDHGFLATLKHVVTQGPKDLGDAALHAPGGIYKIAKVGGNDVVAIVEGAPESDPRRKAANDLGNAILHSMHETARHPLRHPGDTLLLGLPAAGALGRASEAGAIARAGGTAGEVARAAVKGSPGVRTLKVGDLEVRGHYSKAAGSRVVQKATDATIQKLAEKPTKVGLRAENVLHRRASKWERRNLRVADATARAPGTRVAALGAKLKPDELRALRLVAEETPVARRLGAQEMRKGQAKTAEAARHQERIDLTKSAMRYLDEHPTTGAPVFKAEAGKLKRVYAAMQKASTDREAMLKNLDLMDETAAQAAKTKTARVAAGGTYEAPTPGKLGVPSKKLISARARVERIGALVDKAELRQPLDNLMPNYLGGRGDSRVVAGLKAAHSQAKEELQRLEDAHVRRQKPTGIIGADDITASANAVHIGNPVERSRFTRKPKVSSTGTFGHTKKPSSLKVSTGGSVEHAMERNDVTQIVAERHHEAVRLASIDRAVKTFKKAGEATPRRKDDVFVWTNKLISNERIPKDVRAYLDNPEGIAKLPPDEQLSLTDKIKQATFEQHDWRDPEKVAEFEKLAKEGKGVFVSRRLLGDYARRDFNLGAVPGIKFVDAVNNAQKAGLVYLKLNYPVVQGLSNVALNLIEGAFNPYHITKAFKAYHGDPELAGVAKDIMGEGFVSQAAFEGQGAIAGASQKIAHVMSSKVDIPSRLLALYYEASKAGYGGAKFRQLVFDDKNAGDLAEVAQRAKEAVVDFGEMGPVERGVIRRLVFVYPWQKGATKYAGHFLRDHPIQAAALSQAGVVGKEQSDTIFGDVPSYLQGLIPVGGKAVNPAGVNFFQTPAQIGEAVGGLLTGNPATPTGQDFLSPFPGIAVGLATRRDSIGRPLNGNVAAKLRDLTVAQTPAAALARAAAGQSDVVRKVAGDQAASKTFPDPNDAFWRFLVGGLYPREYSKPALNQNAAREKTGR